MPNQRKVDQRKTLALLKRLPLLGTLAAETLAEIAPSAQLEDARRRRVIYMPGDPGKAIYFITSGRVKISRVTPDGKELTLAYRGAGDMFGELCLIDGGPRQDMAEAIDNSVLLLLEQTMVEKLLAEDASFALRVCKALCVRRRELETRVEDLIFKDVNAKLAELLLRLSEDYGVDDKRGTLVEVKITHQEMANLIGSTRETVSLTLSDFKRRGLISNAGRKVIVADPEGLKSLV